jgi:AcrR family transcriptional regulator
MRYVKGQKELTRSRILEVASRRFRGEGVAAVGLAGIMHDADLTNGAFYVHFKSKEDLLQEVVVDTLNRRLEAMIAASAEGLGLEHEIRDYLSPQARDAADEGCPTAALVAEIARHPEETRDLFTRKIGEFLDLIANNLPGRDPITQRKDAVALFGMMVGTLQLARAVSDKAMSDQILEGGIEAGLAIVRRQQQ